MPDKNIRLIVASITQLTPSPTISGECGVTLFDIKHVMNLKKQTKENRKVYRSNILVINKTINGFRYQHIFC